MKKTTNILNLNLDFTFIANNMTKKLISQNLCFSNETEVKKKKEHIKTPRFTYLMKWVKFHPLNTSKTDLYHRNKSNPLALLG